MSVDLELAGRFVTTREFDALYKSLEARVAALEERIAPPEPKCVEMASLKQGDRFIARGLIYIWDHINENGVIWARMEHQSAYLGAFSSDELVQPL